MTTPLDQLGPAAPPDGLAGHRRRRSRSRLIVGATVGAVVVAAAGAAAIGFGGTDDGAPTRSPLPPATAKVTRTTLTDTEQVGGTLGYGDTKAVTARTQGTLTWLPAAGAVISRGKPVYKVDDKPVVLLYGSVPFYRVLASGVEGADVKQLEQNLSALGYSGFTVDNEFTSSTASAVRDWQEDLGLTETGMLDMSQVVVAAGPIRVADLTGTVGDGAAGPVLKYSGTTRLVDIDLDVSKQQLVKVGLEATITLPDDRTVKGKVATVGTVATSSGSDQPGGQGGNATIDVTVTITEQNALGTLDAAPVTVTLVSETRQNVLTVPVAALVALAEGGYGVQIVDNGQTRYVAVRTGLFANGRVEVTGDIAEGAVVGIPK